VNISRGEIRGQVLTQINQQDIVLYQKIKNMATDVDFSIKKEYNCIVMITTLY